MKLIFWLIEILWVHPTRIFLYRRLFKYHVNLDWDIAEFGVYKGKTSRLIRRFTDKKIYLFDSCEGLPEDWGKYKKGSFRSGYRLNLPKYSKFYVGLFKDTIPRYRSESAYPLAFINIDCDLYSSTKDVLFNLNSRILPGTIIVFDEFSKGENKAFREWIRKYNRVAVFIDKANHLQVAYQIIN